MCALALVLALAVAHTPGRPLLSLLQSPCASTCGSARAPPSLSCRHPSRYAPTRKHHVRAWRGVAATGGWRGGQDETSKGGPRPRTQNQNMRGVVSQCQSGAPIGGFSYITASPPKPASNAVQEEQETPICHMCHGTKLRAVHMPPQRCVHLCTTSRALHMPPQRHDNPSIACHMHTFSRMVYIRLHAPYVHGNPCHRD